MRTPKVGDLFTVPDENGFNREWRGQMCIVKDIKFTTNDAKEYLLIVTRLSDGHTVSLSNYTVDRAIWRQSDGHDVS